MNSAYWGGANSNAPILVYTGNDQASIIAVTTSTGFMVEFSCFKGLLLYVETSIFIFNLGLNKMENDRHYCWHNIYAWYFWLLLETLL